MQEQVFRRQCDNPTCKRKAEFPAGRALKPDEEAELPGWIILQKEHVLVSGQPPQAWVKHGCSDTCAMEIIRNGLMQIPHPQKVPAAN